jgi:hypothetical protein
MPVIALDRFVSTAAAAAAAVGLVVAVAGCGESNHAATPAGTSLPSPVSPTVVELRCDPSRTITNTSTAVVDRDGLHLKVTDHSGLNGTYLNYSYAAANGAAPGGGDPVPAGTTDRVLQVPPGDVDLDCSYGMGSKTTAPVKVRASDPNGYYRPVTLAALGCSSTGVVDWAVGPTRGTTAEAALDALVLASKQRPGLRARLAPIGYVGSAVRTYILGHEGRPWATAVVSFDGGEYVAGLDALC